ncbi:AAA family ATPase [Flavobacterium agrisoli]|uniref:AAA family ATPase n=1 Tax=Flavobacterium agrisoli TaxID=2793066 RepID=A0A934PN72_9FLAO|nr:AAA family ATPase [Flavobacterium agrisoli]MBK0369904.1 AAA family ATPase [Flavobacterium agrisoli]
MKKQTENFYIITGGPGVGKTTLLKELEKSGYEIVPEEARKIIKQQVEAEENGLPWKDKKRYTDLMFNVSVKTYLEIQLSNKNSIYLFDRGIIDSICYAEMCKLNISEEMNKIAIQCVFNKNVFILPPWADIYENDQERKQTWEEAVYTFEKMKEIYKKYGYNIIEVPKDTVENRKKFVHEVIENNNRKL